MAPALPLHTPPILDPAKFRDPLRTAAGEERAWVTLDRIEKLWFNTGTLCNLTCNNCYIESSPRNDRLQYLQLDEFTRYMDELARDWQAQEIGFTGGEPFMNPSIATMLEMALARNYRVLVLTNAMAAMQHRREKLLALRARYGDALAIRVSLDHYACDTHELERGKGTFAKTLAGLKWLSENGFHLNVAGRTCWGESEAAMRAGYRRFFQSHDIAVDADDVGQLVLFPEMDSSVDVPEITTACWDLLDVAPTAMMCASSRMVVHRKGEDRAKVVACTLLPYDVGFELGDSLAAAAGDVRLNHPHCAKFCVLGGGSCSVAAE